MKPSQCFSALLLLCLNTFATEGFIITEESDGTLVYTSPFEYLQETIFGNNGEDEEEDQEKRRSTADTGYIHIDFVNPNQIDRSHQNSFENAAKLWDSVLSSSMSIPNTRFGRSTSINSLCGGPEKNLFQTDYPLPAGTIVQDLLVVVEITNLDGVGGTLGKAGSCIQVSTSSYPMPKIGIMLLDAADVNDLYNKGKLVRVIAHEIGHVLGIGTTWNSRNLLHHSSTDPEYIGRNGLRGYRSMGGAGNIDVENIGGSGTANAHWRTSIFGSELMTGYLTGNTQPLSIMTVKSLEDIGYKVTEASAEPYTIHDDSVVDPNSTYYNPDDTFDPSNGPIFATGFRNFWENLSDEERIYFCIGVSGISLSFILMFYFCCSYCNKSSSRSQGHHHARPQSVQPKTSDNEKRQEEVPTTYAVYV